MTWLAMRWTPPQALDLLAAHGAARLALRLWALHYVGRAPGSFENKQSKRDRGMTYHQGECSCRRADSVRRFNLGEACVLSHPPRFRV
jgi:hypothetical protein